MNRRRFLATAASASAVAIAGCGGESREPVDPDDIVETIAVTDAFEPQEVHVETGEAVEWRNDRENRMELASTDLDGARSWSLGREVGAGETTAYLFENSGVYAYHDKFYSKYNRCGAVAVGDATVEDIPTLFCQEGGGLVPGSNSDGSGSNESSTNESSSN